MELFTAEPPEIIEDPDNEFKYLIPRIIRSLSDEEINAIIRSAKYLVKKEEEFAKSALDICGFNTSSD